MKIRKTRQDQRTEYRYPVQVEDGKGGYRVVYHTIRPGDGDGEDIVTELHIQTMHSLDDSEVYYNTKNMRPQRSDSMKAEIAEWKRKYIADFVDKYGYEPHPLDVEEELKERFPSNWNLSLDWEMDDENTDGKSSVEAATAYKGHYFVNANSTTAPQMIRCISLQSRQVLLREQRERKSGKVLWIPSSRRIRI